MRLVAVTVIVLSCCSVAATELTVTIVAATKDIDLNKVPLFSI